MNWKRVEPGRYTSGPYTVTRSDSPLAVWHASGPCVAVTGGLTTKADAQAACYEAAFSRGARQGNTCDPVIGDVVISSARDGRAVITSVGVGARHVRADNEQLYCMKFPRGKRLCLFRHEFTVVVP